MEISCFIENIWRKDVEVGGGIREKSENFCLVINNVMMYFRDIKMISCKKIGLECCLFCW